MSAARRKQRKDRKAADYFRGKTLRRRFRKAARLKKLGVSLPSWRNSGTRARRANRKNAPKTKMRRAPKRWIKAKAVRVVNRGGKRIVEVRR